MAASPSKASETPAADSSVADAQNTSSLPEAQRPPGDLRRRGSKTRRTGPFVKYVGAASLRSIDSSAWKSLNIETHKDVKEHTWGLANDKMVEAKNFSDDQLDYLLIDDLQQGSGTHAFLLVDYDENGQLVQAVYE